MENKTSTDDSKLSLFFRGQAASYGKGGRGSYSDALKIQLLEKYAHRQDECLDLGVANGVHLIPLASRVKKVAGIDVNAAMLDECRKELQKLNILNVDLKQASAADLPFADRSFDLVYSYSTLLLVDDAIRAIREAIRVLRPGGHAILDIMGKFNLSKWYWGKFYRAQGLAHLSAFSLTDIRSLFRSLDLEILEQQATGVLDQWTYIRFTGPLKRMIESFKQPSQEPDWDFWISQMLPGVANRWFFVVRKNPGPVHPS